MAPATQLNNGNAEINRVTKKSKSSSGVSKKFWSNFIRSLAPRVFKKASRRVLDVVDENKDVQLQSLYPGGKPIPFNVTSGQNLEIVVAVLRDLHQPLVNILNRQLPKVWKKCKNSSELAKLAIVKYVNSLNRGFQNVQLKGRKKQRMVFEKKRLQYINMCDEKMGIMMMDLIKNVVISNPKKLNQHYKSFSSETYGEMVLEQMGSIARELGIGPNDVFVDLGSGVGQLVCFMAAMTKAKKSVGIELASYLAELAQKIGADFQVLASHLGREIGEFELFHGSFLDAKFENLIHNKATVIFINNLVFDATLQEEIKTKLFQKCQDGTRIISTSSLISLRNTKNSQKANSDVAVLVEGAPISCFADNASWTSKPVHLYSAKVQRRSISI